MILVSSLAVFPNCPSYGFNSRPDYLVKVVSREGGVERRDRKWAEPLHYFEAVPMGPRPQADIERISAFFHAMGGTYQRFRFKDFADFRSADLDETITPLDQAFEDLGSGRYQLIKTYAVTTDTTILYETIRTIRNPVGATIRVANQLGVEQLTSTWTIDEDTGILTTSGGFSGTPTSWGGEFYVPCRFDGDLRREIVDRKIMSLSCTFKELRPDE